MLYIMWSERQLIGSPFKVTVMPANEEAKGSVGAVGGTSYDVVDSVNVTNVKTLLPRTPQTVGAPNYRTAGASKVICSADGLKKCMLGNECQATIDTYLAGRG